MNGSRGSNRSFTGRAWRTGQRCIIWISVPSRSKHTVSVTVKSPELISATSPGFANGGSRILCWKLNSCTQPSTSPGPTRSPALTVGVKVHFFSRSMVVTTAPRAMKSPFSLRMAWSGRRMPSKMPNSRPGPSSMVSGFPVLSTDSPTRRPEVSSYTWTNAVSPSRRMISPSSFSLPTRTMSYMRAPTIPRAMTAGPAILMMDPVMLISSSAGGIRGYPLSQFHIEPDVFFDQSRDVLLTALELRSRRGKRQNDGQVSIAQQPRALVLRAGEQVLVHGDEAIVQGQDRPEVLQPRLGRVGLPHLYAGQPEAGGGLRVGDHRQPIQRPSPSAPGRAGCRAACSGR